MHTSGAQASTCLPEQRQEDLSHGRPYSHSSQNICVQDAHVAQPASNQLVASIDCLVIGQRRA
jgi:hypothetical protein